METIRTLIEGIKTNNALTQWIVFFSIILLLFLAARIAKMIIGRLSIRKIRAKSPVSASFLHAVSKSITFILLALGVWIGTKILHVPDENREFVNLII